jgi:hypothetical protein
MKKFLVIVAAALLMMGLAGQANASYFGGGDLIEVLYDSSTGVEVAVDLGAISSLQSETKTVDLTTFGTTATWSQVTAAYFAVSATSGYPYNAYIAAVTTPTNVSNQAANFQSAISSLLSLYASSGTATASFTSNPSGYVTLANGSYGGFLKSDVSTNQYGAEVNEANGGTQNLYYWTLTSNRYSGTPGTQVAGISITSLDGVTTVNVASTPIPPSVLLMGTGLLGLVGIGRRKFFA